jgi:hypothetical protein
LKSIPDVVQILVGVGFLIVAFLLSRLIVVWQMRRAAAFITKDLEAKRALDQESAVELPYSKAQFFKLGIRDYRPKVLEYMVAQGVVGITPDNRYFLMMRPPSPV